MIRNGAVFSRCVFGLAVLTLLAACDRQTGSAAPSPAVPVTVLLAEPKRVPIVLEAVGQLQGSKEVEVRARVSGILLKRMYSEGTRVLADAPLFRIDPAAYEIALDQARAQLAQERARSEQTQREAARLKNLAEEKAISQKEYDDAASALKLSSATVQVAEANLRQAELNLSYTLVTAPVSGVAARMLRSEGSLVTAGQETSLLTTINQIEPIWARFSLSESDLAKLPGQRLAPGVAAEVSLVLPDGSTYPGKGRLNFTATQIDPRLATQELRAEFGNARGQLLPGQFVRVRIAAGQRDNVFLVPQSAVVQTEKGYFLYVADKDNQVALRPVQTGGWIGSDWLILDGLGAGDRVILDNLLKLRPGASVSPREPNAAFGEASAPKGGAAPATAK